jgi:SAM-dependent methyltransferase
LDSPRLTGLVDRMAGEIVLRHATGRHVLDLGHGSPTVAQWVSDRAERAEIVDAVDLGRRDSIALPWPDRSFELVYCLRTLPHLGRDAASSLAAARSALAEIERLLVPGGIALVQIDNPLSLLGVILGLSRPARALERGPLVVESARGLTRLDTLPRLLQMLPPSLTMTHLYGLRVLAALPQTLAIPLVGRVLGRLEWWLRDVPIVRRFGAHLLIQLRRAPAPLAQ